MRNVGSVKKYRDDSDAALPTKMSQIVTNSIPHTKLDPLSPLNHQMQGNGRQMTPLGNPMAPEGMNGVEMPPIENNNNHTADSNYSNGIQASTISVLSAQGSRRYLKNPLANGSFPVNSGNTPPTPSETASGLGFQGGASDAASLNGTVRSYSTTASTASLSGTPEPPSHSSRSFSGTLKSSLRGSGRGSLSGASGSAKSKSISPNGSARALGGIPSNKVGPAPPTPANTPYPDGPPSPENQPGSSRSNHSGKVSWPHGSIPKRVKKLSWEDELSNKTELDPEVSVTPMPPTSGSDTPNLTVYF
ncbi:hypothetical protein SK128_012698 [Halocaridina rubra]|uniref:Uncharacterized protein n=1 Tax=Halocaridina rubra TaxID=373956 RepID=A0AAN8X0X1_HALRR